MPDLPPFPPLPEKLWVGKCVEAEKWQELIHKFFSTAAREVEELTEFMEHLVEEVERVAESGNLKMGLASLLQQFLVQGHGKTTHLHWLLLGQLGLAFMVLLVRGNFWEEASHVLAQLSGPLQLDFTSVKLPAIGIFLDLNQVNATVKVFSLDVLKSRN